MQHPYNLGALIDPALVAAGDARIALIEPATSPVRQWSHARLDALFDSGLISFSDNGEMLVSSKLEPDERAVLGIADLGLRRRPAPEMIPYLRVHRETHGFNPPAAEGSAESAAARP